MDEQTANVITTQSEIQTELPKSKTSMNIEIKAEVPKPNNNNEYNGTES